MPDGPTHNAFAAIGTVSAVEPLIESEAGATLAFALDCPRKPFAPACLLPCIILSDVGGSAAQHAARNLAAGKVIHVDGYLRSDARGNVECVVRNWFFVGPPPA